MLALKVLSALDLINSRRAAFIARTYLAILDHKHHLERKTKVTDEDDPQFCTIWRRRSKEWDITPEKHKKSYSYIPAMIALILKRCMHAEWLLTTRARTNVQRHANVKLGTWLSIPASDRIALL